MADTTKQDEESKKAFAYWGYLFQRNKCPTDKLERLLRGIAACISDNFEPMDAFDLRPEQLAAFYRRVGGDYDILFTQMPSQSIAFVYKSLGCLHSLQPSPAEEKDGYSTPTVPALKPRGYVTWQTIQLLLGPEEHVPFIQNALTEFDVIDPATRKPFPKILPRNCLPMKPDPDMVAWHEGVSNRLRLEADDATEKLAIASHEDEQTAAPENASVASTDERTDAVKYFSNPHYRNHDGRPAIVRSFTRAAPKVKQEVMQGGKAVALTVRNIANPYLWSTGSDKEKDSGRDKGRRRSRDGRTGSHDHEGSDVAFTPSSQRPTSSRADSFHHVHTNSHSQSSPREHHRHQQPPRGSSRMRSSRSSTSSEEYDSRDHRHDHRSQSAGHRVPRHYRSHEPASSPREYFGHWDRPPRPSDRRDRSPSKNNSRHRASDRDRPYSNDYSHQRRQSGDRTYSDEGSRPQSCHKPRTSYFPSDSPPTAAKPTKPPRSSDHYRRTSVPHIATPTSADPIIDSPPSPPPRGHPNVRSPQARPISGSSVRFTDPFDGSETPPRRSSTSGMPSPMHTPDPSTATASELASKSQSQSMPGPPPPPPLTGDTSGAGKRPLAHRYVTPVGGVKGRRYPNEATWR